jgi:hypothetical protein
VVVLRVALLLLLQLLLLFQNQSTPLLLGRSGSCGETLLLLRAGTTVAFPLFSLASFTLSLGLTPFFRDPALLGQTAFFSVPAFFRLATFLGQATFFLSTLIFQLFLFGGCCCSCQSSLEVLVLPDAILINYRVD